MGLFTCIKERREKGLPALLLTIISGHEDLLGCELLYGEEGVLYNEVPHTHLVELMVQEVRPYLHTGEDTLLTLEWRDSTLTFFLSSLLPTPRLIILGGGHVGGSLVELAAKMDFRLTLIDDRQEFVKREEYPLVHELLCIEYSKVLEEIELGIADYVVICTRGHRYDYLSLRTFLGKEIAYLGMVGSRKKVKLLFSKLREEGYREDSLEGVSSPIGLPIGGETPFEIALSILAEVVSVRRKGPFYYQRLKRGT